MRTLSIGTLSFGAVSVAALVLVAIGPPGARPVRLDPLPAAPAPSNVSVGGFTLTSTSVDLPIDDRLFPDGPHSDLVSANCTSCHSASMALTQPRLSAEQWKAIVEKMRETYKAPVAKADVAAIVAYLTAMSGTLAPEPPKRASGKARLRGDTSDATG